MPDPDPNAPCGAADVEDFLAGRGSGDCLLHALYDHVLREPVPPRMVELVRQHKLNASVGDAPAKK